MRKLIDIDNFCEFYYEKVATLEEICSFFGCSKSSVGSFRNRAGLPSREVFYPELRASTSRQSKTLFAKGLTPWNKNRPFPQIAGRNNPNWKGGQYISTQGYKIIKAPKNHPYAYKGYIREHRLVVERHMGRFLNKDEHVHHLNGDKLDNRISNLIIVSPSEHAKIHQPKGSYFGIHQL